MLNNGKSSVVHIEHYIFSMELNIMQIFSFTYSSDIYQKSKFEKKKQSYCYVSAMQSL